MPPSSGRTGVPPPKPQQRGLPKEGGHYNASASEIENCGGCSDNSCDKRSPLRQLFSSKEVTAVPKKRSFDPLPQSQSQSEEECDALETDSNRFRSETGTDEHESDHISFVAADKMAERRAISEDQLTTEVSNSTTANDDNDSEDGVADGRYKHMSATAACEHLAKKQSQQQEGGRMGTVTSFLGNTFIKRITSSSSRTLVQQQQQRQHDEATQRVESRDEEEMKEMLQRKKAEKNNEAEVDDSDRADEKKAKTMEKTSTDAANIIPSYDDDDVMVKEEEDRYRHLSAAGEHFARKKAEGESPSLLSRMTSSLHNIGHHHHYSRGESSPPATTTYTKRREGSSCGNKEEIDDKIHEVADRFKHLSAAGEHFARKNFDKKTEKAAAAATKKNKKETNHQSLSAADEEELEVDDNEGEKEVDRFKHLSAACEHFARKNFDKKTEKAAAATKKKEKKASDQLESPITSHSPCDDDTDRYKHLSAAGEHSARKKAATTGGEGGSSKYWGAFIRMTSKNSIEREDCQDLPFQHSRPNENCTVRSNSENIVTKAKKMAITSEPDVEEKETGEHVFDFANVSLQPYDTTVVSAVESSSSSVVEMNKHSEGSAADGLKIESLDDFSDTFVQGIKLTSDASDDRKVYDDCGLGCLDQCFDVVINTTDKHQNEYDANELPSPSLTAEEDVAGREGQEDFFSHNEKENLSANAASAAAVQSQLDKIQRMPAYTIHRDLVIGMGSYGHVCLASRGEAEGHFSSKPGRREKFACKCVSLPGLNPKHICKLQEEVNVLRVLRGHDNVIRLYDVFILEDELLIITELGSGGDLVHLLATHPKQGLSEEYAGKRFMNS